MEVPVEQKVGQTIKKENKREQRCFMIKIKVKLFKNTKS